MATCKWCERSGWLLSLSANGMCDSCEATEVPLIVRRVEAIRESQSIVDSARTFQTRIESCHDIIRTAEELIPYELKGITVVEPSAAELKAAYEAEREKMVTEHLEAEVERILARAKLLMTPDSIMAEASKALLKIDEARSDFGVDDPILDKLEHQARRVIQETQLNSYLREAEKEEFKGNRDRALDRYQEALFLLTTEGVDHGLRAQHTGTIEKKMRQLRRPP